jgi:hypothetical protein
MSRFGLPERLGSIPTKVSMPRVSPPSDLDKKFRLGRTNVNAVNQSYYSEERCVLDFGLLKKEAEGYVSFLSEDYPPQYRNGTSRALFREIERCWYVLRSWNENPDPKKYHWLAILKQSILLGPEYADFLKKDFKKLVRSSHSILMEEREDFFNGHYGSIPQASYLINWGESTNDYLNLFVFKAHDPQIMEAFEEELKSMMEDIEIDPMINEAEILFKYSSSMSFDPTKRKNIPFYKARLSERGMEFSDSIVAQRCVIPVCPAGYRDAQIMAIDSYNACQHAFKEIFLILNELEESCLVTRPFLIRQRIDRLFKKANKKNNFFFLRDLKKSGLTFPHELLRSIVKVLMERWPHCHFNKLLAFDKFSYFDGEKWCKPVRGLGLGQECALLTLAQVVAFRMLRKNTENLGVSLDLCTVTDDMCLSVKLREDHLDEFSILSLIEEEDLRIINGLGLEPSLEKSLWSKNAIFCEEYTDHRFEGKHGLRECALGTAFTACNIYHAKMLVSSLCPWLTWKEYEVTVITSLINHWGYEFYDLEHLLPFELGGWISYYSYGLNEVLRKAEETDVESKLYTRLVNISKVPDKRFRPDQKRIGFRENFSSMGIFYQVSLLGEIPEELISSTYPLEVIASTREDIERFYKSVHKTDRQIIEKFNFALKWRRETFRKNSSLNNLEFLMKMIENFDNLALPKILVVHSQPWGITELLDEQPELYSYPVEDALEYYLMKLKESSLITFKSKIGDSLDQNVTSYQLKDKGYVESSEQINVVLPTFDTIDQNLSYLNPNIFLVASEFYKKYKTYPFKIFNLEGCKKDPFRIPKGILKHAEDYFQYNRNLSKAKSFSTIFFDKGLDELFDISTLSECIGEVTSELSVQQEFKRKTVENTDAIYCLGHRWGSKFIMDNRSYARSLGYKVTDCKACDLEQEIHEIQRDLVRQQPEQRMEVFRIVGQKTAILKELRAQGIIQDIPEEDEEPEVSDDSDTMGDISSSIFQEVPDDDFSIFPWDTG